MSALPALVPDERVAIGTLDRTFTTLAPQLPPSLVSPGALDRVLAVTRQLPAALTRFAYLECRLAEDDPQVDVIFDICDEGKLIIAGRNPAIGLPPRFLEHPAWQRIRDFCRVWMDPTSPLFGAIRSIWLEFDLDRIRDVPVPGVFIRFEGGTYPAPSLAEAEKYPILRDLVLPLLLGRAADSEMLAQIEHALNELPPAAQLTEAGLMLQRSADSVRLCFRRLAEDQIIGYLLSIGWRGDFPALASVLKSFSQEAPRGRSRPLEVGYLDIDVGRNVGGTLGLEYFMDANWQQLVRGVPEKIWLDQLVSAGLCTRGKRDGLLAWPGYSHASFPHEVWPSIVVRHFNHIKFALAPDRSLFAKAYLFFYYRHYKRPPNVNGAAWTLSSSEPSIDQPLSS